MKILNKVEIRKDPLIRTEKLHFNDSQIEVIQKKFWKGSYTGCFCISDLITLVKQKNVKTLAIDAMEISLIRVNQVVNNCGLDVGVYLKVDTIKNAQYGTDRTSEYYNITL